MAKFKYGQRVEVGGRDAKITAEAHPDSPEGSIPLYEIQFEDGYIMVVQEAQIRASVAGKEVTAS